MRLVGGQGGWRKTVPPKQYNAPGPPPAGVATLSITTDVAITVGELAPVLDPTVALTVGSTFTRQGGAASAVLNELLGDSWWLDPNGLVQTAPRLPTPVLSPFTVSSVRGAAGLYRVETESPADWTPGKTFVGPTVSGTVNRVTHVVASGSFHSEVMVP